MKVMIVANGDFNSSYGGGQLYVRNLVDEMIRQKRDVAVLSFISPTPTAGPEVRRSGYRGILLYETYSLNPDLIVEILNEFKPDLLHINAHKALMVTLGNRLGIKTVVTAHHGGIVCPAGALLNQRDEICKCPALHRNCLPCVLRTVKFGGLAWPLLKRIPEKVQLSAGRLLSDIPFIPYLSPVGQSALAIQKKKVEWDTIVQFADIMIAPSEAIASAMVLNGMPVEKIRKLKHGIPLPERIRNKPADSGSLRFFYNGRISYEKGLHILLSAFAQIKNNCELRIIGGAIKKTEIKYLSSLQTKYSADKRIKWFGKLTHGEAMDAIMGCHVMVHPAICLEIYGLSIAESLSLGMPVIATRCGGAEMQIEEGVNGWLVKPNDVADLRNSMIHALAHRDEVNAMGERCPHGVMAVQTHVNLLFKDVYEAIKKTAVPL